MSDLLAVRPAVRPFVGRAQELGDLDAALVDARSGRGSLLLLSGEPGIGKSRLLAELGELARDRGVRVVAGRCWEEGGAPPYWPWLQVVRELGGDLERLAASLQGRGVAPETERLQLFDELARFVAAHAAEEPLLITVDDIHAADEPSLLLLRFLADALSGCRVLLVASYRDSEPRVRELRGLFADIARVGRRTVLRGLTAADVAAYVGAATGDEPTAHVVARVHEITGGNPFFVGEVVRVLASGDAVVLNETRDPLLRIPEEVRTLIHRRVAALPGEAVAALRVAAVLGREFELHLLQRMGRLSTPRLLEVLQAAVTAGLLAELPAHRYAFVHELVRETLYDELPPGRRLELHAEIGRVQEEVYADDLDTHLSEIARHLYLAAPLGDPEHALERVLHAGQRASAMLAYEEAVVQYGRALELLPRVGDSSGGRRRLLLLRLGDAQWRSGDGAEARRTFESAIEYGRALGDAELLAEAALGYVTALGGFLLYARFEVGGSGVGLLEEALAALPEGDSSLRAHLLAHLALEMWSGNDPVEQRVAVSDLAIEMARRLSDSEALVTALHARHWALTTPGMVRERLAHTEEMLRVAKERLNPEIEFLAHNARFHCFLELCDRRGMEAESAAMSEIAERLRQPFYRWHTTCLRSLRAMLDGRFRDAERYAADALELGRLRQSEYATYVFRYAQVPAMRWAQGRFAELWPEIGDHAERYPWIPRWRDALAAAGLRDEELARRELELAGARDFDDLPRDGLWILHLCALADACVVAGDSERAERLYELLLPHALENAVSYTQQPFGPVALRLGRLAALLGRWSESDRHFAEALARCELLGARAIRGHVLLEHAAALAARGEPADEGRREAMLAEAEQLFEQLELPELAARASSTRQADETTTFHREGDFWTIVYDGRTFRIRDVKGLRYVAMLLAAPGREVHVLELAAAPGGEAEGRATHADGGAILDEQAKQAFRRRLAELEEEVDQALAWGDDERAARTSAEREALTKELARALGLGGRDRTFSSPAERARVNVTKAIRTALRLIARESPELARHLDQAIQTGRFCRYAPPGAAPPRWSL